MLRVDVRTFHEGDPDGVVRQPHAAGTDAHLEEGLHVYFQFYNHERLHQSLGYHTPAEVHCA